MTQPLHISVSSLSRMSDRQLKRVLHNEDFAAQPVIHVDTTSLPNTTQFALVALHYRDPICRALKQRLQHSTVRYGTLDLQRLRKLMLADFDDKGRTILTEEGLAHARSTAIRIAKELGLHEVYFINHSMHSKICRCTCGWSTHLASRHLSRSVEFGQKVQQHLLAVARGAPGST